MNKFTIELLGRRIPIKTLDSEDYVNQLVGYIENKIAAIDPENKMMETTRLLLCLLNVTDDLHKELLQHPRTKERKTPGASTPFPPNIN